MPYTRNPRSGVTSLSTYIGWYQGCCTGRSLDTECCLGSNLVNSQKYYNFLSNIGSIKDKEILSVLAIEYLCFYARHLNLLVTDPDPIKQKQLREQRIKEIRAMLECIKKNSCIIQKLPDPARAASVADNIRLDGGIYEDLYQPAVNFVQDNLGYIVLNTMPTRDGNQPIGKLIGGDWHVLGETALIKWMRDVNDPDAWKYDFWYWDSLQSGLGQHFRTVVDDQIESHVAFLRPCWRTKIKYQIIDPDNIGLPVANVEYPYRGFRLKAKWFYDEQDYYLDQNYPIHDGDEFVFNEKFSITDFPTLEEKDNSTYWEFDTVRGVSQYEFFRPNNDCVIRSIFEPITVSYSENGEELNSDYYSISTEGNDSIIKSNLLSTFIDRNINAVIELPNRPLEFNSQFYTHINIDSEVSNEAIYDVKFHINYDYDEGEGGRQDVIDEEFIHEWSNGYEINNAIRTNSHSFNSIYLNYLKQDVSNIETDLTDHFVKIDGNTYKTSNTSYYHKGSEEGFERVKTRSELDALFKEQDYSDCYTVIEDYVNHVVNIEIEHRLELTDDSHEQLISVINDWITEHSDVEEDATNILDLDDFVAYVNSLFDSEEGENIHDELLTYLQREIKSAFYNNYIQQRNLDEYLRVENGRLLIPVDTLLDFDLDTFVNLIVPAVYKFNRYCYVKDSSILFNNHPWYSFYFDSIFKNYGGAETTDTHYHQNVNIEIIPDAERYVGLLEDCKEVKYRARISDDEVIEKLVEPFVDFKYYKTATFPDPENLSDDDILETDSWTEGVVVNMYNEDLTQNPQPTSLSGINANIIVFNEVPDINALPKLHLRFTNVRFYYNSILDKNGYNIHYRSFDVTERFDTHHISEPSRTMLFSGRRSTTSFNGTLDPDSLEDTMALIVNMNFTDDNTQSDFTYDINTIGVASENNHIVFTSDEHEENDNIRSFYNEEDKSILLLPQDFMLEDGSVEDIYINAGLIVNNDVVYFKCITIYNNIEDINDIRPQLSLSIASEEYFNGDLINAQTIQVFKIHDEYETIDFSVDNIDGYDIICRGIIRDARTNTVIALDENSIINSYNNDGWNSYSNIFSVNNDIISEYESIRVNHPEYGNGSFNDPYKICVFINKITE